MCMSVCVCVRMCVCEDVCVSVCELCVLVGISPTTGGHLQFLKLKKSPTPKDIMRINASKANTNILK